MPNINDFKLISKKSEKYFQLLTNSLELKPSNISQKEKERLGFYLFMLENLCNIKDIIDLADLVTDSEFNKIVFNKSFEDHGIDAIQIDEDENNINLFNFKYREKFNPDQKQSINETIISTKFINALISEDFSALSGKLKIGAQLIIEKLIESNDVWKLNLFVVSNEFLELEKTETNLKQLEKVYGLEVFPIGLNQISKIMSIRPEPIDSEIIIDNDAIMSFTETSISSSKSYVLRLSASEIIRITCDNKEIRSKYNIEDVSELNSVDLDYSVLFDNVRGLVLKSKYNKNIEKTLKLEPSKFFMYNNGLTITASDIVAVPVNGNKRVRLTVKSLQVLNGGQTLRTLHSFNQLDEKNIEEYISKSEVLVRVFKITQDDNLNNKIAEFTNSQNSISNIDLKSLRSEQIQLEQYLDENDIVYSRKNGDIGITENKSYKHKISMERYGQILFSLKGNPEKASNQKKQIFEKYYDEIFGENNLKIDQSPNQVSLYYEIRTIYLNLTDYIFSEQKVFYILYLNTKITLSIIQIIDMFEKIIKKYEPSNGKELSEARKIIQIKFKEFLDEELDIRS